MRRCARTIATTALLLGAFAGAALAQESPAPPPTRGGFGGVTPQFPNVFGLNRTLPIERKITRPVIGRGVPTPYYAPSGGYGGGYYGVPAVVGGRSYYVGGDGLTINGKYVGDKWKLGFHLGSPGVLPHEPPRIYYPSYGWGGYSPWSYYRRYGSYYRTGPVDGYLYTGVDSTLRMPQLAQTPGPEPEPERELTTIERARILMAADRLEDAVEQFRDHLDEDPEDVEAMRSLGVALLESGRMEDGAAMIGLAYRTDPVLARTPFDTDELGFRKRRYDSLLSRVLQFARRTDSGSAHLAGVVLLQADGKVSGAARVLDRAEASGLADEVVDALRRELGMPATRG